MPDLFHFGPTPAGIQGVGPSSVEIGKGGGGYMMGMMEAVEAFEKTGGALDLMGVRMTRTSGGQTVWAPGTAALPGGQEWWGGWCTPGDYNLDINVPRIHNITSPTLSGVARHGAMPQDEIVHRIWRGTDNFPVSDGGWMSGTFIDPYDHSGGSNRYGFPKADSAVAPITNFVGGHSGHGTSLTVNLQPGDVLEAYYGARGWTSGTASQTFTADDGADTLTNTNHGWSNGRELYVTSPGTTGLLVGTFYYVVNTTANTLQLSLTPGGPAVNLLGGTATLDTPPNEPWGSPGRPFGQRRNASDPITVYCVASEPEPRAGFHGTGSVMWLPSVWQGFVDMVTDCAAYMDDHPGWNSTGGEGGAVPNPIPETHINWPDLCEQVWHRAFHYLRDGEAWTGNVEDTVRLIQHGANLMASTSFWHSEETFEGHGAVTSIWGSGGLYPPEAVQNICQFLAACAAFDVTPSYEPLRCMLIRVAQHWCHCSNVHHGILNATTFTDPSPTATNGDGTIRYWERFLAERGVTNIPTGAPNRRAPSFSVGLFCRALFNFADSDLIQDFLDLDITGNYSTSNSENNGGQIETWYSGFRPDGVVNISPFYAQLNACGLNFLWASLGSTDYQFRNLTRWHRRSYWTFFDGRDPGATPSSMVNSLASHAQDNEPHHWANGQVQYSEPQFWFHYYVQRTYVDEPRNPAGALNGSDVDLTWSAQPSWIATGGGALESAAFSHYRVYRGTTPGLANHTLVADNLTPADPTVLGYTDSPGSGTWYYSVTAVGTTSRGVGIYESSRSDEVTVVIP